MKKEDLKNTKIYLHSVEDRMQFKNKIENLGIRWVFPPDNNPIKHDIPFIYIDEDLELFAGFRDEFEWFCEDRGDQIFLEDVLSIEEPERKCMFKTFDKVLVRNSDISMWIPKLFFRRLDASNAYLTIDGETYNQCIPYEDNEGFMLTSRKPIVNYE